MTEQQLLSNLNASLDPLRQWLRGAMLEQEALNKGEPELAEGYFQLRTRNWERATDLVFTHLSSEDFYNDFNLKVNELFEELYEEFDHQALKAWNRLVIGAISIHG